MNKDPRASGISTNAHPLAVAVIGLGYVGSVVAASIGARGTRVYGVDVRADVVAAINNGIPPIQEPNLANRLERAHALKTLTASCELASAIHNSDVSLVCVGTPVGPDGQLVETFVIEACQSIAQILVENKQSHTIVIRSTVPPGLYARAIAATKSILGAALGTRVCLALNPEFLREGAAVKDLEEPEYIVFATDHANAIPVIERLYDEHRERLVRTEPAAAEVLKLVSNVWHALKVSFANEVARVAGINQVDAYGVMQLLCRDGKLNTSSAYLRPGLPFGGACLVKDVAALDSHATRHAISTPVICGITASNQAHLDYFVDVITESKPTRIAMIGIGFKPGAADVRDSAPVRIVLSLLDRGLRVTVADSAVLAAKVPPLGLDALRAALGDDRAEASASVAAAVAEADLVVAAHPSAEDALTLWELRPRARVLDLAGELTRALGPERSEALRVINVLGAR